MVGASQSHRIGFAPSYSFLLILPSLRRKPVDVFCPRGLSRGDIEGSLWASLGRAKGAFSHPADHMPLVKAQVDLTARPVT